MTVQIQAVLPCGHVAELGDVCGDLVPYKRDHARAGLVTGEDRVDILNEEPVDTLGQPVDDVAAGIAHAGKAEGGDVCIPVTPGIERRIADGQHSRRPRI